MDQEGPGTSEDRVSPWDSNIHPDPPHPSPHVQFIKPSVDGVSTYKVHH